MDASFFGSALSHTRRSDASRKREKNNVSTFCLICLWTSFKSSPVSVKEYFKIGHYYILKVTKLSFFLKQTRENIFRYLSISKASFFRFIFRFKYLVHLFSFESQNCFLHFLNFTFRSNFLYPTQVLLNV